MVPMEAIPASNSTLASASSSSILCRSRSSRSNPSFSAFCFRNKSSSEWPLVAAFNTAVLKFQFSRCSKSIILNQIKGKIPSETPLEYKSEYRESLPRKERVRAPSHAPSFWFGSWGLSLCLRGWIWCGVTKVRSFQPQTPIVARSL